MYPFHLLGGRILLDSLIKLLCSSKELINSTINLASSDEKFDLGKDIFLNAGNCSACHSLKDANAVGNIGPNLNEIKPDIIIVLGDRYEIMSAAIAASFHQIPIAHIGGGDTTLGAFDEWIRHSITKMSWFHFVSNPLSKKRITNLANNAKYLFPELSEHYDEWLGFRPSLPDFLPVIGPSKNYKNLFYAFGHHHLGWTLGAITGKIITGMLAEENTNLNLTPYSSLRFS